MSIKEAAEKQEQETAARQEREAEARPDTLHRAVHFLLRAQVLNDRDTKREAEYFMRKLDEELGNDAAIAQLQPPSAAATEEPSGHAADDDPAAAHRPRQSKRFQR